MQFLIAGGRANAGVKAGRYMFEVRILECLDPLTTNAKMDPQQQLLNQNRNRGPLPRQLLRVGFSTGGPASPLILGESEECVYFDSEGFFGSGKTRQGLEGQNGHMNRGQVIAVVLNKDPKSPNA